MYCNQYTWQSPALSVSAKNFAIDSGTVSLTVGGLTATTCFGPSTNTTCTGQPENVSASDVASALAQALNVSSSPVTAAAYGASINMIWKTPGVNTQPVSSLSTAHDNAALFPNPSFHRPPPNFARATGSSSPTN